MDISSLIKKSYQNYGTIFSDYYYHYYYEYLRENLLLSIVTIAVLVGLSIAICWWRKHVIKSKLKSTANFFYGNIDEAGKPRFRKRDKMLFYGRRMLRKVKSMSGPVSQARRRKAVIRFASRILQMRNENMQPELRNTEPPAEYLEEASDKTESGRDKVPVDALYMLQSIRIFGQFEKPVFLKICKHTEIINVKAGDYLFKIGDPDDSVFIVQSGQVNVFLNNPDGSSICLKVVRKGETVTSLLSFIDVIVGNMSTYKTVTAKATEDSQVIRLPMCAFKEVFDESPDLLVRVIQVIMVRLQRVTISALHNYLGLNTEYIQIPLKRSKQLSIPLQPPNLPKATVSQHKRQLSDQFSLVTTQHESQPKPDMLNDIEFPPPINRRTSQLQATLLALTGEGPMDEQTMKNLAVDGFLRELGLNENDRSLVEDNIEIKEIAAGTTLTHQGRSDDVLLIYVITGGLFIINQQPNMKVGKKSEKVESHTITIYPGEVVGGLAVLTGESSLYTIRSKHFTRVGLLAKEVVYNIMRERPSVVLDIANSVVKSLSPLVRQCDFALDWIFLESGRAIYRQEESSDCTYIVLNGRLRSVVTQPNGKKEIVGEFGKGDLIGIVEMITETPRTSTVIAVRDSELAKLPEGLFNAIKLKYPVVVTQLISLLSHRILGSMRSPRAGEVGSVPIDKTPSKQRFSTVTILAISEDVPLTAFTYELYHSLLAIGPTIRLTSDQVRKTLGPNSMESSNEYRLTSWLSQQEDRNDIALYQCDLTLTPWTQRCLRQADVILIVGLGYLPPSIGKLEREIDRFAIRTAKELVLLHNENMGNGKPTNTVQWLNTRSFVSKHHHILCPKRMFTRKSIHRINDLYSKVLMSEPNIHSDFSRLARWLTGNSVGLVLGGGGARGGAHVGMLKAIQEAGIPVDMVGGVSIGAFMGALWCSERNITTVTQKAREWCKKMTQWGLQLLDLTYPITSMFSGRQFNQTIRQTFGDIYIEDLWIPYFTLTTDITASSARIHTHGSLWRYVRSSMSLSGYMPPLCDPKDGHLLLDGGYVNNLPGLLWRYCRASMSYAGIYPPIPDKRDGHLLIDGCYVDNVPADVMRSQGAAHILAVDVGSQDDTDLTDYGDDLSGWWVLYKRYNPFTSPVKVPALPDIQSRLAYVSCVRQLEQVKNSDYCEYLRPPIDKYKTLAFGSFDEIKEVGYNYGKSYFEKMSKEGGLSRFNKVLSKPEVNTRHSLSEYTFVDLAQIVCKVPETYATREDLSSDDDYFEGYASEPSTMPANSRLHRGKAGGSLSLSEHEYDSDDDDDLARPALRIRTTSTSESTRSPDCSESIPPPNEN